MKKPYETPRILHSEKMEGRAVACAAADENSCPGGPLQT
jgi:hypothetical protein